MRTHRQVEAIRKRWLYRHDGKPDGLMHIDKGTKTSGNWGHKGIPGHQGGSQPGGGHEWLHEHRDTFRTKDGKDYSTRWLKTGKKTNIKGPNGIKDYIKGKDIDEKSVKAHMNVLSDLKEFGSKHPDLVDGTFSAQPPYERKDPTRGFQVTFHQNKSEDDPFGGYSDEDYARACVLAREELGSENTYYGNFGNPEVSFTTEDIDDAMSFAIEHNQQSIWDNKAGLGYENPFYNRNHNPIKGH